MLLIARLPEEIDNLKPLAGRGDSEINYRESPVISYEKAAHKITCFARLAGLDAGQLGPEIIDLAHLQSGGWLVGIGVYLGDHGAAGREPIEPLHYVEWKRHVLI